jgi:L-glutamine:2-deoxy-scyllo-inosose/3-amino-2,3-dideoxy-scyllo-inosose aminotransferase
VGKINTCDYQVNIKYKRNKIMSELALWGGPPVSEKICPQPWPPISESTADKMKELYLSRAWSFNSQAEQDFEASFAKCHGAKHAVFMVNGTVTLECALLAAGIGEGDEVIVPALTWIATAMAVRYVGAIPVFVDVEPTTLCLDPEKTEAAITPETKAVIPVHLYGSMADIDKFKAIADKHNLFFIEDCAHMHGGKWNELGVGSWGDVGSFSFQQSKTLSSGEGGICLTNDDDLAMRLYRAKHIGYERNVAQGAAKVGPPVGLQCHNYRGTAFQATILKDQLEDLPELIERYNRTAAIIKDKIADIPGVRIQTKGRLASPQGYYALTIIFDGEGIKDVPLERIIETCEAEGLKMAKTYGPVYQHLLFNLREDEYRIDGNSCPVSEIIGTERAAMLLHSYLACDDETASKMGEIIAKVVKNHKELL